MALVYCSQCGKLISENAAACPNCGQPTGKPAYTQPNQAYQQTPSTPSKKDKTTAGILALVLGGLGIHYFYLEKPIPGVVFILCCWTFIPSLLALAQGIMMLTMTEADFNQKYVNTQNQFPMF